MKSSSYIAILSAVALVFTGFVIIGTGSFNQSEIISQNQVLQSPIESTIEPFVKTVVPDEIEIEVNEYSVTPEIYTINSKTITNSISANNLEI